MGGEFRLFLISECQTNVKNTSNKPIKDTWQKEEILQYIAIWLQYYKKRQEKSSKKTQICL